MNVADLKEILDTVPDDYEVRTKGIYKASSVVISPDGKSVEVT